jgi:hypothetical protein
MRIRHEVQAILFFSHRSHDIFTMSHISFRRFRQARDSTLITLLQYTPFLWKKKHGHTDCCIWMTISLSLFRLGKIMAERWRSGEFTMFFPFSISFLAARFAAGRKLVQKNASRRW